MMTSNISLYDHQESRPTITNTNHRNMDQMLEDMYTTEQYADPCQDGKLRIMQLNASGIQGKCDEILEIILSQRIAVTFISETWLRRGQVPHPCISHCYSGSLPDQVMNHQPHGLAIMIHPFYLNKNLKDVIEIIQITEDPNPVHGPCFILCRLLKKFVTLFVYLSPTWSTDQCISTLIPLIHEDSRLPRPDILLGDFNMRLGVLTGDTLHNQRGQVLNDATSSHGYSLIPYTVIGTPTFVSPIGESIVDLFYGTAEAMTRCTECTVLASSDVGSDHVPCVLTLVSGTATPSRMPIKTKYRVKNLEKKEIREEYQRCFTEKIRSLHECFSTNISDWSLAGAPMYQHDVPDDVSSPNTFIKNLVEDMNAKLTVSILDTCRTILGTTRMKKKSAKNWFLDERLRDMIYARRDYYKKWKATDDPIRKSNMRIKYVQQKALVQKECQTKKRLLFDEWTVKVDTMKKSEMTKVLSGMLRKRSGKSVSALDTSDTKMTEYTTYFATLYTNQLLSPEEKRSLLGTIPLIHQGHTPLLHQSRLTRYISSDTSTCHLQDSLLILQNALRQESLDVISLFSDTSISEIIMYLPNAKAPGPSSITAEMLKPIRADVSVLFTLLFTLCYITGYVPAQWRQAMLCPILKKGNPSDIENYRPIIGLGLGLGD